MKRIKITEELAYGTALERLTGAEKTPIETKKKETMTRTGVSRIKLSVFLDQEEDTYLENLSSTAKFSGGRKLSKTKIIESMVRAFRITNLDVNGVKTEEELYNRLIAQLRQ